MADDGRHLERRGQEVDHRVEQRLDALVAQRDAAEHGGDRARRWSRGAAPRAARGRRDLGVLEVGAEQPLVELGDRSTSRRAGGRGRLGELGGDGGDLVLGCRGRPRARAGRASRRGRSTPPETRSRCPIGSCSGTASRRGGRDRRDDGVEVGADAVQLVDEGDPRHAAAVGLVPDGLGLRLARRRRRRRPRPRRRARAGERSTSIVKSTWPGVSMRLMLVVAPGEGRRRRA